jgi:CubicO group peptidase (beta-lactamase class C family)
MVISARDHARFGLFISRNGAWDGKQILPADWMQRSLEPTPTLAKYGLLWGLNRGPDANPNHSAKAFSAQGAGGNCLWISPEDGIVAVMRWLNPSDQPEFLEKTVAALRR